jgi:hypothetical protein
LIFPKSVKVLVFNPRDWDLRVGSKTWKLLETQLFLIGLRIAQWWLEFDIPRLGGRQR